MKAKQVAVVTGSNRGIGYQVAKELAAKGVLVIVTSRDENKGKKALSQLESQVKGGEFRFHPLDVSSGESIQKLAGYVEKEFGKLDILVNNAGIMLDHAEESSALKAPVENVRKTFETNTLGPFQLCQALVPLMRKNRHGRIVNISSGMGQLSEMNGGWPAYRISKTALNAVTRIFADETSDDGILVNSVCPGWVKTDMGGAGAERSVEKGAETVVWLATLPEGGPTGGFYRDREKIEW